MVYQGSKNRLSKELVPIIQKMIDENNITNYIEPMVGGANMIDKIMCEHKVGGDINGDLIALLKYVQSDPELKIAPEHCDFEHYADVRASRNTDKYTQEYTALIGYCASYGGRYFEAGYGRDSKGGREIYAKRAVNLKKQAPKLAGIEFINTNYLDMKQYKNALYYFDPPYNGTQKYAKQQFDYDQFYDYLVELSADNIVLISEYYMPEDRFECIWQKERTVLQRSNRTSGDKAVEKLFVVRK